MTLPSLMITLIEELRSHSAQREIIVLDDVSDMMRYGEEKNVLQMITECKRLRDEGSSIIVVAQSYSLDQKRREHLHELCDVHVDLQATSLGEIKGILLTVHKANGVELTARNTVAFRIVSGMGMRAVDVPRTRA